MKRSHAVLVIAECLIEPHFEDNAIKEASYILSKLEKYGMLPPSVHTISIRELPGLPGIISYVKTESTTSNHWEPEDGDET